MLFNCEDLGTHTARHLKVCVNSMRPSGVYVSQTVLAGRDSAQGLSEAQNSPQITSFGTLSTQTIMNYVHYEGPRNP